MAKVENNFHNDFCPQSLFLYGTKKEDGTPDFGLFCWFSYVHTESEGSPRLGVMACIGEDKLTKDLIRKNGVFSANLVTEKLLPLADYYGTTSGRNTKDKMKFMPTVEQGKVLDVPTIAESPVSYELRVQKEIHLVEGSDVFICEICNVAIEESLSDKNVPFIERLKKAAPVLTCGENTYESIDGKYLGGWGEPKKSLAN
ncbi:MAG: flavin reductase [Treponemataceae bacterium]|nr:flavin reductase [Treponemataceae bacterium]